MKNIFIIILSLFFTTSSAQSWFKTYNKSAEIIDICEYNDSFFGFGGSGVGNAFGYYILRINTNGDTLFTKSFNDISDSSRGRLYSGFLDYNKDLVMVGYTALVPPFNNIRLKLIKTDTLGNLKWIKTFNMNPNDMNAKLIQTYDSCYAIFGESNQKGFMLKTDRDGNLVTTKDYGYNYTYIKSVVQDADSGFTFCGFDNVNFGANFRSFICKTNSSGDTLWTKMFYDSNKYFFNSIAKEASGGYYIGATDTLSLYVLKVSSIGNVIWKTPVNKKGYLFSIGADFNNSLFCSGYNETTTTDSVYFAKFNVSGNKIFEKSWASNSSHANKSIQSADSAYIICGYYADSSLVIKLETTNDFITNITQASFGNVEFGIFPNPTNSLLNIIDKQNQFKNSTIEIKNYLGQVVFTTPFTSQINISELPTGMYFLTLQNEYNFKSVKIIKQ